jgi:hypothetical protein
VTYCYRQSIGSVIRARRLGKPEQCRDHALNLPLGGVSGSADGIFDCLGRVGEALHIIAGSSEHGNTARLTYPHGGADIFAEVEVFQGHGGRLMPPDQLVKRIVNTRQPFLGRIGRQGADDPPVKGDHVTAFDSYDAETEIGRPGIYAHYDSHLTSILSGPSDVFRGNA